MLWKSVHSGETSGKVEGRGDLPTWVLNHFFGFDRGSAEEKSTEGTGEQRNDRTILTATWQNLPNSKKQEQIRFQEVHKKVGGLGRVNSVPDSWRSAEASSSCPQYIRSC